MNRIILKTCANFFLLAVIIIVVDSLLFYYNHGELVVSGIKNILKILLLTGIGFIPLQDLLNGKVADLQLINK